MTEKRFIEQFEENVRLYPDKVILRDEHHSLTFRELDELSGRVYAYLKFRNIGKEQSVMISLPRGVEVYAAVLGVWKAGSIVVLQEENAPTDKKQYVFENSKCVAEICRENFCTILNIEPLFGHEKTDAHDAAFACYTSGSSGFPKGILHEYGKLEQCGQSMTKSGERMITEEDNFGITISLSSTAEIMFSTVCFYNGAQMTIMPLNILHDVKAMSHFFVNYQITCAAFPPSILKYEMIKSPCLRWLVVGSEPVRGLYTADYPLYNLYCQSECAITVATFLIDKPYANAPIGTATDPNEISVRDEDGNEVRNGELGELCYRVRYTRGYINLPQLTQEVYQNGWCYTGDIARKTPNGDVELLGRKTEMIKINGNRIEPSEIEDAVKQELGLQWVLAKGFEDTATPYVCVYYNEKIEFDEKQLREALLVKLPRYMIPSFFVYLESVPYLPNGKVDRQALKAPEIAQYRAEYVAPENELEERLCREMEKVLNAERFGALDDFYLLGGDSLRTIELVTNLDIEDLAVTDIYAARTPRAIAERWMQKMIGNE